MTAKYFIITGLIVSFAGIFAIFSAQNKDGHTKKETTIQNISAPGKWENVGNFPVQLSGNTFNRSPGPNGERKNTGEVFVCTLSQGYEYRFTFSGQYQRLFGSWDTILWSGYQNHNVAHNPRKPPYYPRLLQGALTIRVGNDDGLHPAVGNSFLKKITSTSALFAEVNLVRKLSWYHRPAQGGKLKNSTLSIRIERRTI